MKMRECEICCKEMTEGYCVQDTEYYCCDDCLHGVYSKKEYDELFDEDCAYWTMWADEGVYDPFL